MIIKYSLVRLTIIFLLVIIFPLIQQQWLNLYLFDVNNFTIYKALYYLSGLIVPIFVIINSLKKFTYYKFYNRKNNSITGKLLLLITICLLTILSFFISEYIFTNLKLIFNFKEYIFKLDADKQILFIVIISTFLILKKSKVVLKKIILINYFIFSIINWYSTINNSFSIDVIKIYNFTFENLNFLNIVILLAIEISFYLWSYISYSSYLSDWNVPMPKKSEISPILKIVMFYLLIILYYSILFN